MGHQTGCPNEKSITCTQRLDVSIPHLLSYRGVIPSPYHYSTFPYATFPILWVDFACICVCLMFDMTPWHMQPLPTPLSYTLPSPLQLSFLACCLLAPSLSTALSQSSREDKGTCGKASFNVGKSRIIGLLPTTPARGPSALCKATGVGTS